MLQGPRFVFQPSTNQKLGFLEGLLNVGAWKETELLLSRLPAYYVVSKPAIAKALQRLIHQTIDPLHQKYCTVHISGFFLFNFSISSL